MVNSLSLALATFGNHIVRGKLTELGDSFDSSTLGGFVFTSPEEITGVGRKSVKQAETLPLSTV